MTIRRYHSFVGLLLLIVAGMLTCGCTTGSPEQTGTVTISSNTTTYSPVMSHTVGIDLTAHYSGPAQDTAAYHWTADYGEFVAWNSSDSTVQSLGSEAVNGGETIYWTYQPEQPGAEPAVVRIAVDVEDTETGKTLATAERKVVQEDSAYRLDTE